jgi:hypothetical protein
MVHIHISKPLTKIIKIKCSPRKSKSKFCSKLHNVLFFLPVFINVMRQMQLQQTKNKAGNVLFLVLLPLESTDRRSTRIR